ncbi:MAG: maleate cis-trans isomerase [Candidatus Heimdallarchaeota archaeon]
MNIEYRIGLMVPSSDITIEKDFCTYLPPEISFHVTRMPLGEVTPEKLTQMAEKCPEYAKLLADVEPELIVYGCTSGSFIGGKDYDEQLEKKISETVNVPVITTAHAVVDCLQALNKFPIVLLTPYTEDINKTEVIFFEENNLPVIAHHGMGIIKDLEIGKVLPEDIYNFVVEKDEEKAKSVFVSCTNLRVLNVLTRLRKTLNKPIVTSNLASMWAVCQYLMVRMKADIFQDLYSIK